MARSFIGYTEQLNKTTDLLRTRRSENAKAWSEFLEDAATTGRSVTPEELDRYRMSLTGGDSYFLSALPSREMMKDIAARTNQRVADTVLTEATNNAANVAAQKKSGADLIPIDADEEGAREAINRAFGPDAGAQWWSRYGDQWHIIQDNKVNDQVSTLMSQPRFQQVQSPEDINVMYPQTSPRVRAALRSAVTNRLAADRQNQVQAAMLALSTFSDPNIVHMNDDAIRAQVAATAAANGLQLTGTELQLAIETLTSRQGVVKMGDETQRKRALHADLTAQNSPLWQMLEGADGANLNETAILEAINTVAGRHGFRFASIEEATKVLGEDYFTLSQKIRAGIEYQRKIAEVTAQSTARADQISEDNSERLAMAANAAVQRKEIPENGTVFMAIKSLADDRIVFADSPDTVVRAAREFQRKTKTEDFTEIKNYLIDELRGKTVNQLSSSLSAEAMLRAGIGPAPRESAVTFIGDFQKGADTRANGFYEWLSARPETSRPNGVWDAATQAAIIDQRNELEGHLRALRQQLSGINRANFLEFGVNQSITHEGRDMSLDEYINIQLRAAEERLMEFDRQVNTIRPEGSPVSEMPLPERLSGGVFDQQDGESRFGAWRRRGQATEEARKSMLPMTQGIQRGTAPTSYFTWKPEDYRRHGFANAQEMEQFRAIIGWSRPNPRLLEYLAANPEALSRFNDAPLNQQPQLLLQFMRQIYPDRQDLNFLGGQNAPAQQPGRP